MQTMFRPSLAIGICFLVAGCSHGADAPIQEFEDVVQDLDLHATATTGVLRGVVIDAAVRPLQDARIELQPDRVTSSNANGAFGFDGLEEGSYSLRVSKAGYMASQQVVQVVAGDEQPPIVRVMLSLVPSTEPYIEQFKVDIFLFAAYDKPGGYGSLGNPLDNSESIAFELDFQPNATLEQSEFVWDATTPLGTSLYVSGATRDLNGPVNRSVVQGSSPLMHRARASNETAMADSVSFFFHAADSHALPVQFGLLLNQKIVAYVLVFHHFEPPEDWLFTRDGAPEPPGQST